MNTRRRRRYAARVPALFSIRATGGQTEPLEDRTLLSNLAITDAYLVDGTGTKTTSPILGERLEIRADYTTDSLSASAVYAIRVIVDGVEVDRTDVTYGAGFGSGTWFAGMLHGYAEAGSHNVQVMLDSLGQIAEDNENDNGFAFSMTPVSATNLPQKLSNFVTGTAGVDWRITNFADLDPRPGMLRDFRGGQFTYDLDSGGHDAIDLGPDGFAASDQGIGIYAAADGVVSSVHDGEFDRNIGFADPAPAANYVIVDHGNGWQTAYLHLRRDSVSVKVGDSVSSGKFLGWMGSSGFSSGAHVHFSLRHGNHHIETMLDPATFWVTPPAYPADYRHAIRSGFSSTSPTASEWTERPEDMQTFTPGSRVYFWVIAGAMLPGDTRTVRFLRPNGSVFFEQTFTQGNSFFKASRWFYFANLPSSGADGTWTADWQQNGIELANQTFTVSSAGAPEIRVEQGTQYIRDQRFTPIDFGTVAANATAPVQSFTITNAGSAPLTLGAVSLPPGYELATAPAATVQPGQTTTLDVRLLTTTAGYFGGELRLLTNDADEPVFRLWLEGIVETPGTATLIPGFSVRSVAEGTKLFANIRRTGSTANAVTVTLTTDASELIVPATVTIPAGSTFVNFEVQAVQDISVDGDQRVQLLASAAGLTSGRNEVLVQDVLVGQLIVTETNGSTSATEGGITDQISVALSAQPATDVVINVTSNNVAEVAAALGSLTFTPANWSTPQFVTISAVDDGLIDGTQATNVRFAVNPLLSDGNYVATPASMVAVTSLDNDVAGFEISQSDGTTVAREQTFTDSILIRLTAQPRSNVVLNISNPNSAELAISPASLTITPAQWNVWQLVTFAAVADGATDGDQSSDVSVSVTAASDADFVPLPAQTITVVTEDVRPSFQLTETAGRTVVRENGPADAIAIVLTAQPVSPVVIRAQAAVGAEFTLDALQWTFDASNWNIAQTVSVSATDDISEEPDENFLMTFSVDVAASDAAFQATPAKSVSVTVEDDEPRPAKIQGPAAALLGNFFTLSWTPVSGAVSYELWVNFVSGGVDQIVRTTLTGTSYAFTGFNEMGIYRVWVRATVASGFTTRWSAPHDVRVLGQVVLQSMPRFVNTATPTFSWNAVATAVRYDLWVDDVLNGRSQLIRRTDLTTTSFNVPTTLSMGQYRVWVRAIDARGQATAWSVRNEFIIATQPTTTPTLLATFDQTPTLRWEAVSGARKYDVWVRNVTTGVDVHKVSNILLSEWTVPANLTAGPYRWWVRAFGDYGITGLWSVGRDLFVGGRPVLLTPVVAAGSIVTFNWTPVEGAFEYRLQVDRLDVPQSRVVRENSLFGATWQTPSALSAGTYRAWVQAVSISGQESAWSKAIDFIVT